MPEYLLHGRRHGPTGSDPIPGLGAALPSMYGAGLLSGFLPSSVTAKTITVNSIFTGTSDASIMEPNSSDNAWYINENGVYLAVVSILVSITGSPSAGAYAEATWNLNDDHGVGLLGGQIVSFVSRAGGAVAALGGSIPLNVDAPPIDAPITIAQTSGVTADVQVEALVTQLNPTPLTLS